MKSPAIPATTTISVFTRHSPDCPKVSKRDWKRCNCRKAIYIYEDGHDHIVSARTRSWEQAERLAQAERDRRDPVKKKLVEIAEQEARKAALKKVKNITVEDATGRWLSTQKIGSEETAAIYKTAAKRINSWAEDQEIGSLADITADMLDLWRGQWSDTAEKRYNRIGATSQSHFQGYLKRFFRYAVRLKFITSNPAQELTAIKKSTKRTEILSVAQFEELLATIPRFTEKQSGMLHEFAKEFRALFLLQWWSGMRILDCLMLPRTALVGDNLRTKTKKTGAQVDCILPDEAVAALQALSSDRPRFLPDYFFWSKGIKWQTLSNKWDNFIRELNKSLSFKDAKGQPMRFHSHMLRDSCSVHSLLAGMALEDVSKLLTHESITVTEKYYGHWVPDRLRLLKQKSVATMKKRGATVTGQ
jgi:site-specific recombinase XerD